MSDNRSAMGTYVPDNFKLNRWLLKANLSMGAKLTYSVLACCCNGRDHVWPSQAYLAKCLSIAVRTVQRYLKELVDFGLIRIDRKYLMGQTRSVYSFLNHALVSFEPKVSPSEESSSSKKIEKGVSPETSKTTKRGDKNNTSYNREESFIDNKNIPPTPQNDEALKKAELLTADAGSGEGEVFNFGVKKENSKMEDPAWIQAKKLLAEKLSEFDLKTWIEPIAFEKGDCQAVLRAPNDFFLKYVKQHYGCELEAAFKAAGVPGLRFELLTAVQMAALEAKSRDEADREAKKRMVKATASANAEHRAQAQIEFLPPESKFDLLYSAYPVKKEREKAEKIFLQKHKKGELPSMTELFKSIKDHQAKDRWWREKMPPLLCNWLINKKWQDKPYE